MARPDLSIVEQDFRIPYSLKDVYVGSVEAVGRALGVVKGLLTTEEVNYSRRRIEKTPRCLRV